MELACPKSHPATLVLSARRGNREAAAEIVQRLERSRLDAWNGVTLAEMRELAAGDTEAVKKRRAWKARVRSEHRCHPGLYRRWSVRLGITLRPSDHLSSHREFTDKDEALVWAKRFIDSREALLEHLNEISSKHYTYTLSSDTQVDVLDVIRERLTYPWYWVNGHELWESEESEWRWESDRQKALVAKVASKR